MIINDRFTRGWVAGAGGGLLGGITSILLFYFGVSRLRLSDWSAILIFGRVGPFSLADEVYALLIMALSTGFVGIIFAFLLQLISEKNMYFKGWIIFLIPWWILYLCTALAQTDGTLNLSVFTSFSNGISTSITGLTAVYTYRLLDPELEARKVNAFGLSQPAAKRLPRKDHEDKE